MSHHVSLGSSSIGRPGHRSVIRSLPRDETSRSKPSYNDHLYTPTRGRGNDVYGISDAGGMSFIRSNPPCMVASTLRCLVGKFEAMDALSLPIQDITLQPAPLSPARNSPRRRGRTRDSSQKRLSTILSPTNRSLSKDEDVFVDENVENNTRGDTPSGTGSTMLGSPKKQMQYRRLKTPQRLVMNAKTPSKSENRILSSRSTSKHRSAKPIGVPAYELPKKSPNKKIGNTIMDRIRFFDGSPDEKIPPSPSKTSPPKTDPSKFAQHHDVRRHNIESSPFYSTVTETPASKVPTGERSNTSRASGLTKGRNLTLSPKHLQYSPTSRKQRNVFGEAVENPFLTSQGSSEKTRSSMALSPHSSPAKPAPFGRLDLESKADSSPRGRSLARYEINITPTRNPEVPKIPRARGRTIPSRKDPKTGIQRNDDSRRNQISEKIEAIYQAKSQERKAQSQGKTSHQKTYEGSPAVENGGKDDDIRRPPRIKDTTSFRSQSKVADMRMRFDGGASFAGIVLPGSIGKEEEQRSVEPIKERGSKEMIPTPPPAPPPPVFFPSIHRKDNPSPKHSNPPSAPHNLTPKSTTPRKQTPVKALVDRISTLPLGKPEKLAVLEEQTCPKEITEKATISPGPVHSYLGKWAQTGATWPRSGIQGPKQVRQGLIADRLKIFEEIARRNEMAVISPGKEKKKEGDNNLGYRNTGKGKIARTLIDDRKECFEISPVRDIHGNAAETKVNLVIPMAILVKNAGKGKGKERGEANVEGEKMRVDVQSGGMETPVQRVIPPTTNDKAKERSGSREPRVGRRKHIVGKWNDIPPLMDIEGIGGGDPLPHLPIKRGLRDARMHLGRDGSGSIDWDEVEREIVRKGGLDLDLEVLVGRGMGGRCWMRRGVSLNRDESKGNERGKEREKVSDASVRVDKGGDVSMNMVVKEAECGLREPKPLRAVEMKRMEEICRNRERDRERERSRGRKMERGK